MTSHHQRQRHFISEPNQCRRNPAFFVMGHIRQAGALLLPIVINASKFYQEINRASTASAQDTRAPTAGANSRVETAVRNTTRPFAIKPNNMRRATIEMVRRT